MGFGKTNSDSHKRRVGLSALTLHGVFLSVSGIGTLIIGEPGTGKSDCALELVSRGHALIADDVVNIARIGESLIGEPPDLFAGMMEVRGLGIIDIRQVFGPGALCPRHELSLCIVFAEQAPVERIASETLYFDALGVKIPKIVLTVGRCRVLPLIIETAVKQYMWRSSGLDAESDLIARYNAAVAG